VLSFDQKKEKDFFWITKKKMNEKMGGYKGRRADIRGENIR